MKLKLYYMQFQGSEFGPMPWKELHSILSAGKIRGAFHVWAEGMENWLAIKGAEDIAKLTAAGTTSVFVPSKGKKDDLGLLSGRERRGGNRWPIVATVAIVQAGKPPTAVGLCRDVSRTGMSLVLEQKIELQIGTTVDLEVRPVRISGLAPFRVKGKVAWANAKDFSAGVLFAQITKADSTALAKYLDASERRSLKF